MRIIGIILLVLGIVGLFVSGNSFTTSEEVVDVGPLQVEREEERTIPFTPIASGVLIVVGGVLTAVGIRRDRNDG